MMIKEEGSEGIAGEIFGTATLWCGYEEKEQSGESCLILLKDRPCMAQLRLLPEL
jgi:hypothetical protein